MKAYRKPSGVYIELGDTTPVSSTLVQVAPRPSALHVFASAWATAPLDPAICWVLDVATARTKKIAETKAEAQRRIYALLPQWRQANLTARGVELNTKLLMGGTLTQAEKDEQTAGFALWEKVKAIRAASNQIEQDIQASADPASFDVVGSARWPA